MSEIRVTTLKDTSGGNASTSAEIYSGRCKAWVNFNGAGTVAARGQFNVNSLDDNGTGNYSINFASALSDTNFTVNATTGGTSNAYLVRDYTDNTARTTSKITILCVTNAGAGVNPDYINVVIFR